MVNYSLLPEAEHPRVTLMRQEHKAYLVLFILIYHIQPFFVMRVADATGLGTISHPSMDAFWLYTFAPTFSALVVVISRLRLFFAVDDKKTLRPTKYLDVSWRYGLLSLALFATGFLFGGGAVSGCLALAIIFGFAFIMWYKFAIDEYGFVEGTLLTLTLIATPAILSRIFGRNANRKF